MVLQTTLTTRSCARRWTVFEPPELLRIFSPPLLPSQLTVRVFIKPQWLRFRTR